MSVKLPYFQTVIMASYIQTGVVSFSLPRMLAEQVGTNGWVALFICAAISAFNIWIISRVYRISNGKSIYMMTQVALPNVIRIPLFSALAGFWAILGSMVGKEYILILKSISFQTLNPVYLYIFFEILVFSLMMKGIISVSKIAILTFGILLWSLFLLLYVYSDFSPSRMTTFWFKEGKHSLKGYLDIYLAFLGYETCLMLFPYVNKQTKLIRAFQYGNLYTLLSYVVLAIASFGFFSFQQLQHIKFPILNLLSYIQLPFLQRIDDFYFNLIIFRVLITNVVFSWASLETLNQILPVIKVRWIPYAIVVCLAGLTFFVFPSTLEETQQWLGRFGYVEVAVAFILPTFLLICYAFSKYRRRDYA